MAAVISAVPLKRGVGFDVAVSLRPLQEETSFPPFSRLTTRGLAGKLDLDAENSTTNNFTLRVVPIP